MARVGGEKHCLLKTCLLQAGSLMMLQLWAVLELRRHRGFLGDKLPELLWIGREVNDSECIRIPIGSSVPRSRRRRLCRGNHPSVPVWLGGDGAFFCCHLSCQLLREMLTL